MAQIAFIKLPNEFTLVEDIISEALGQAFSFDATKTYSIEARGLSPAIFCEPDNEPANSDGVMLDAGGYKNIKYKTGRNLLYAKSNGVCWCNIHELED